MSALVSASWRQLHTKDLNFAKILIAGEVRVQKTKQSSIFYPGEHSVVLKAFGISPFVSLSGKESQLLPLLHGYQFPAGGCDVICAPTSASPIRPAGSRWIFNVAFGLWPDPVTAARPGEENSDIEENKPPQSKSH